MRAIATIVLVLLFAGAAGAADTATFGMKVITTGDSIAKVYQVAGEPTRVVPLENRYGAGMGERLEYHRGNKVIQITIQGGRVVRISEIY